MMAPAHKPELKPQHPLAHSPSFAHGPVINCVPAALPEPPVVEPVDPLEPDPAAAVAAGAAPDTLNVP